MPSRRNATRRAPIPRGALVAIKAADGRYVLAQVLAAALGTSRGLFKLAVFEGVSEGEVPDTARIESGRRCLFACYFPLAAAMRRGIALACGSMEVTRVPRNLDLGWSTWNDTLIVRAVSLGWSGDKPDGVLFEE